MGQPQDVVGDSQTQKEVFYCRHELLRRTLDWRTLDWRTLDWRTLEDITNRNQQNLRRSLDAS